MKTWLVAHRGALKEAQENTIAAFTAASKYPIGYIEFDVRLTNDGVAIIHHDPSIKHLEIATHSYSQLLEADQHLAKLDQIENIPDINFVVELKSPGTSMMVAKFLKNKPDSYATSFIENELIELFKLGVNKNRIFIAQRWHPFGLLNKCTRLGFGGISINKWYYLLFAKRQSIKNINLFIYTVNSKPTGQLIRSLTPSALICTNRPNILIRLA